VALGVGHRVVHGQVRVHGGVGEADGRGPVLGGADRGVDGVDQDLALVAALEAELAAQVAELAQLPPAEAEGPPADAAVAAPETDRPLTGEAGHTADAGRPAQACQPAAQACQPAAQACQPAAQATQAADAAQATQAADTAQAAAQAGQAA